MFVDSRWMPGNRARAFWRSAFAESAAALLAAIVCVAGPVAGGCRSSDGASGRVEVAGSFGRTGRGNGEFIYPRAIARAADGTFFVADRTGRIQRFDGAGTCLGVFRTPQVELGYSTGLSVGPDGNLYVADTHYHRVIVYTPGGKELRRFGRHGRGDGCFLLPTDVAFDGQGRIYVSEYSGNDRVSVFAPGGRFLYSFGEPGSDRGQFMRPSALCVDRRRGRLYVADACNHRIAVYDLTGRLSHYIGSPGQGPGQLGYPYDLALLTDGTLVVCEYGNNRLQLFSPQGQSLGTYGGPGRRLGRLAYPWGVAVDGRRRAYVLDSGNNRVQVWQL